MELDYLKEKKEFVSIVLLGVSALMAVLILVNAADFFVSSARAEQLVADAVARSKLDANDTEKYFEKSREIADELKKKNLFAPPPKKEKKHPVKEVTGIWGDALINGKWYGVGDKVGDAKIVAIGPTSVTIEWEGKEKVFAPIKAADAPKPQSRKQDKAQEKESEERDEKPTQDSGEREVRPSPRGGRRGRDREERVKLRARRMKEREARLAEEERR